MCKVMHSHGGVKALYECFHCGERAVIWGGDFGLDEWEDDPELDGVFHVLHCTNCGAEITYVISDGRED